MLGSDRVSTSVVSVPGVALLKPIAGVLAAFLAIVAGWYGGQVVVLDHSAAAAVNASVARASAPLTPDEPLQIAVHGAGVQLLGAQLFRAEQADDGSRAPEQVVAVRLQPADADGTWLVAPVGANSLLAPDGTYRLAVRIAAQRPALPLPRADDVEQQYRFTTVASPHARVPREAFQPRWAEPVSFTWSEPMQSVSAAVEPPAPIRTWIDARDPRTTWVQVGGEAGVGLIDGQTYDVRVTDARAADGISLQRPLGFRVVVPKRPTLLDPPTEPVVLHYGDNFSLKSSMDLADARVTTSDDAPATVTVGPSEIRLDVPEFQQGAEFDLNVLSATSRQGAPLTAPLSVHFVTPPPLEAPTIMPDDGSVGIQPTVHPSITFPEPLADPSAVIQSLAIDPPVAGQWQWTSPTRAEFIPNTRLLPILTDLTLSVRGGPDGPRTAAGGYLESDISSTFRTTDYKRMEVSLNRQTMTLYEFDRPVRTINVATGVAAAPTPTGTFSVQYKSAQMRFRGVNPDGSHYDIPDVHWVMPFWGDYTIHGAYWRPRFGVPGSDGCVSMTDTDAKLLFDWADVGTPLVIHN